MNNIRKAVTVLALFCGMAQQSHAQFEPQFTQYMFNEMYINPAYAGSRDQISSTLVYRNQWVGLQGAPKTETASIHGPLMNKTMGLGLTMTNETIGVTHQFSVYGNYAYRIPMGTKSALAMGIQGGIINHQENLEDVITNEENDPEFLLNTPHVILPNAGFGLYFNTDRFYAGLSVPRMLENKVAGDGTSNVTNHMSFENWHYYFASGYVFPVSDHVKLRPTVMVKAVSGAPIVGDFTLSALMKEIFWLGFSYRTEDSFAGILEFQITPQLRFGYSYDYTTTELNNYSNGTHEINIGYDFSFNKKKVITPRYF
ncbi:MAG TPA: type IX secretion system membrane protein PorP/SprF [Bacteroidia bacterium]|nr:type IX secretion system membrane protein PorP/SprF [Bacteroidia bacterium]